MEPRHGPATLVGVDGRPIVHVQKVKGIGGSERHLLDLLPALRERGVDARMWVLSVPGAESFIDQMRGRGVPVRAAPIRAAVDPISAAHLHGSLRSIRPALVHTHLIHADLHGAIVAAARRLPTVASVHSVQRFYARAPYRSAVRIAFRQARRVIAISGFVRRYVEQLKLVDAGHVATVPYGIDADRWDVSGRRDAAREALGIPPGAFVVATTSRLIPGKGHRLVIEATRRAHAQAPSIRLVVAGGGPLRSELEAASDDLGDAVKFLGFLDDVREVLAASDVLAFPTDPELGEGFGLSALEAMAAGVPVVATRVASLPEVIGDAGVLLAPGDPVAFGDTLADLASDSRRRERLAQAGRARARKRFSLDQMVSSTLAVYAQALDRTDAM